MRARTKSIQLSGTVACVARAVFYAMLCMAGCAHAQSVFDLRDGDRVIFYGDSITEPRMYTNFVETYAVTRFPALRFEFRDSAWGGDRVTGGRGGSIDVRLQRDVLAYRPSVVAIMLGINDGWGLPYDPKLYNRFCSGYEHIIKLLTDALPGLRVTVMRPSPYDEVTRPQAFAGGGYNGVLVRYGEFVKRLGEREGLTVADLNAPLVSVLVAAEALDHALARRIAGDGIDPGIAGHLVLAAALLRAWHAPALVSSVEIDAAGTRVARTTNANISALTADQSIGWTETDDALPFPIDFGDPAIALVVRCSDIVDALDLQLLKVTGLKFPRYMLSIDGQPVEIFDRGQLDEGVNLAVFDTPMSRQAANVHALTSKRNEVQFGRWRQVESALQSDSPAHKKAALDALDELERDLLDRQHAAALPRPHHFELKPQ